MHILLQEVNEREKNSLFYAVCKYVSRHKKKKMLNPFFFNLLIRIYTDDIFHHEFYNEKI